MPFPCPGCGADVPGDPESWALRCPACRRLLRSRALGSNGSTRAYEVEVVGQPDTRRRVEVAWDAGQQARLRSWLAWASLITLALVGLLFALARSLG